MQPTLQGRRILITRALEGAGKAADAFRTAGAIPVLAPTIQTRPATDPTPFRVALEALQPHDWLVLTSPTAARVWVSLVGPTEQRGQLAVIGEATADVLNLAGLPVTLISPHPTGTGLAAAIVAHGDGRLALLPRSDRALAGLPEALRGAGMATMDLALYQTESRVWDAEEAQAAATAEAVTVMSPSAVTGLLEQAGVRDWLPGARLVAMGPTTADAVLAHGLRLDGVADPVSLPGLVAATAAAWTSS